jgi:hypothetical protein
MLITGEMKTDVPVRMLIVGYWRLIEGWSVLRTRQRVVLISVLVGLVFGFLLTLTAKPVYSGSVLIDPDPRMCGSPPA